MCGQRIEDSNEFHIQRQCRTAGAPFRRRFHSLRSRCAPIKNNFNWRIMLLKAASCSPLYRLPSHQSPASRSLQKISSLHGPCSTVHGKHQNIFRFTFVQFPVDFFIRHESALLFTDIKSWLGRHFLRFAFYFYRLQFDFFLFQKKKKKKVHSSPITLYYYLYFCHSSAVIANGTAHVSIRYFGPVKFGEKIAVCWTEAKYMWQRDIPI